MTRADNKVPNANSIHRGNRALHRNDFNRAKTRHFEENDGLMAFK
ncbi:hypothetical protein [Sphingomonas yabuuchiae]